MKRKVFLVSCTAGLSLISAASAATLINYQSGASSPGNGAFFSDPTGVAAPAGVSVNSAPAVFSSNTSGRAIAALGSDQGTTLGDIATITNNQGVTIDKWTIYRVDYVGGNNGMGFLENGGRLGKSNAPNDGVAFANSGEVILVSDAITVAGADPTDVFNLSFLSGDDTASGWTGAAWIVLDDTTWINALNGVAGDTTTTTTYSGNNGVRDSYSDIPAGIAYSSVRLVIDSDAGNGSRTLIDDVFLEQVAVPEPSSTLLVGLGLLGLTVRRRR